MSYMRILRQVVIAVYLLTTLLAFVYTMNRTYIPIIPKSILRWSYGAMAPFQNYSVNNSQLIAHGQLPDGTWENINLRSYYPHSRGESVTRQRLNSFMDNHEGKFTELAGQILNLENNKGSPYQAVRLTWEQWPKSHNGFEALHTDELTEHDFVAQFPLTAPTDNFIEP